MGLLGQIFNGKQRVQFIQNSTNTLIQFDATLKENHKRASTPTKFPIENGSMISDHVIISPFNLDLTAIITDTPLGGVQGYVTEAATTLTSALVPPVGLVAAAAGYSIFKTLSNSQSPSVAAYNQILQLQENAQPFDVLTSLYRYPSMWISAVSAPRDSGTGSSIVFDLSLEQLILVSPQSVNVQIFANPGLSANKADLGQQGLNLSPQYQAGFNSASAAVKSVVPGGLVGGQ